jgi:hypothetical protein
MSERPLTEALRRLHDRAAAAALAEEPKSIGHENFRASVRRLVAEEIRGSSTEPIDDLRLRVAEVERKLDEFMQILGSFENEAPPPTSVAEPAYREPVAVEQYSSRRRQSLGLPLMIALIVAVAIAALVLVLAITDLLPASLTTFFDKLAAGFRSP